MYKSLAIAALTLASASASPFASKPLKSKNSGKAKMMSKLLDGAKPTENSQLRKLEQEIDLTGYEVKFQQCQLVRGYSDELAEDEEMDTVLGTQKFVIFRLCPAGSCESCAYNYGEYVIDMENYLMATTEYFQADREDFCGFCNEICEADDDANKNAGYVDCDSCYDYCANVEAMEDNGYVESAEFAECIQVYQADDDGQEGIFAGAMCSSDGDEIYIGAFEDDMCSVPNKNVDVENYLENGLQFNHEILQKVYAVDSCVSCIANEYELPNDDSNADDAGPEANELCMELYELSAKCESKYGFDNWWAGYEEYYNQYLQEDLICDFINSLEGGNYDQYGEIVLNGKSSSSSSGGSTGGQKFALTVFILATVGLGAYAASLHSQLTKGGKADLSSQGGAMA
eukprot:CAMPEP_0178953074 /NCGR_PEP_ID=MMETSP0789-20121207/8211_1 /TAXON_ID=3005 /ORGANISM="Rhizosolenia setigera, Strain CCMP 1694" /LENGTH=399 /DNA_ID=CAMNT_0020634281 /DNA_START=56 /DNA_END=1255 /DNA_ORIENTATION=+